ncbi:MAG: Fic family protein [Anaerolineae bacterium]|jgi:Fic family protein|nr:Fic family protein [Anaerolineae bacterium]MBT4312637.1 Fic family protein [Anaerolineae bacterium]MBT7069550.1 Fic family protein [Anaerolineae bacterium]MBT7989895.1 Fic family protein [Anaerolineae bacterium]
MLETRLLNRITQKKAQLDMLRPLSPSILTRLNETLTLEWIYNSNAIEGSTLTLQETRLILETGLTIGGKSLREHFEVTNHREAIAYVENLVGEEGQITPYHVRLIHALVLKGIDDENAGRYRETPVRIAGATHTPPESWEISRLMDEWGAWLIAAQERDNSVNIAAEAHHRLVNIHPFVDGNGRTARLIMNLLLIKDGYPPSVIERVNRQQYYRVLAQADEGNLRPLVNFVGRAVERSLTLTLEAATPRSAPPPTDEQWIPLSEAAQDSPYTKDYLSLLARKGRLEALKRGRNWYTTRKAVEKYRREVKESE